MDQYISVLYQIVTKGLNANSYKFALWRALARLASGTDQRSPKISKQDLAALFVEFYWPLEIKYHLRQGTDPDKDPAVMTRIRALLKAGKIVEGERLRAFKEGLPANMEYSLIGLRAKHSTMSYRVSTSCTAHQLVL
jgi:hypothetical protein